tara:strand:- start:440 stop:1036 length:597 start_codon:yes stop_codon:yes gene_type:complete
MQNVKQHNVDPSYVTVDSVITDDLAKTLMDLVDTRGKKSTWSYNPDCIEYQIANPFSKVRGVHDKTIETILSDLFFVGESFLRTMNSSFQNTIKEVATGYHGFWVLKYLEQGQFQRHCDWDASYKGISPPVVGTAAILLNDDFTGGEFLISDNLGNEKIVESKKLSAIIWDGWTQHRVAPVTQGERYALVMHYTGNIK